MEEVAAANSEPTEQEHHTLERQTSWALPEIAPSPCSLVAWGRADLGQAGIGSEAASIGPVAVDALQSKDIVYAAGSVYNSAYVTRTPHSLQDESQFVDSVCPCTCCRTLHSAHAADQTLHKIYPHPLITHDLAEVSTRDLGHILTGCLPWQVMARLTPQEQTARSS